MTTRARSRAVGFVQRRSTPVARIVTCTRMGGPGGVRSGACGTCGGGGGAGGASGVAVTDEPGSGTDQLPAASRANTVRLTGTKFWNPPELQPATGAATSQTAVPSVTAAGAASPVFQTTR